MFFHEFRFGNFDLATILIKHNLVDFLPKSLYHTTVLFRNTSLFQNSLTTLSNELSFLFLVIGNDLSSLFL